MALLEAASFNWDCVSVFDPVKTSVLLLLMLVLLVMLSVGTSSLAHPERSQTPAKERTGLFKIPVWMGNATAGFQTDLKAEDFHVVEGNVPLELSKFLKPESPTLLFIAFDTVGEIANINQARAALNEELEKLSSQYWVGLISAQEQITVAQDPTPDRKLLREKIEGFTQIGKAGLLESIQSVADFTSGILLKADVRVAVIFVTDSDIGNYRADYLNPPVNASDSRDLSRRFGGRALQEKISRMAPALAKFQAPIFIVHIDPGRDPLNRAYQNGLKQFAQAVGGQLFLSKTVGDIPTVIQEVFQWVRSFYVLGFEAPRVKSGFLKVQVSLSHEPGSSSISGHLIYPSRLFFP
ncbi:MAG: hypothetical protein DMG06_13880 [Acidobacteria bacterium]|nr:MAG: hypothetical protein DMG06_13880 [Acidobacteriota bacterium]